MPHFQLELAVMHARPPQQSRDHGWEEGEEEGRGEED